MSSLYGTWTNEQSTSFKTHKDEDVSCIFKIQFATLIL